ncbi:hypothetical protein HYU08_01975 [Candidatus Woesearchaeota archaeon]|nr:hypothetical protein [Candidatus Woesearchaeota archaeon]
MPDLEYRLGGVSVHKDHLNFSGSDSREANHKFVVEAMDHVAFLYIADSRKHRQVANKFNIPNIRRVGGGSCYINSQHYLVLDNYSAEYGSIPRYAAQRFAQLLRIKLEFFGVMVAGIMVNPDRWQLNDYWKKFNHNNHNGF